MGFCECSSYLNGHFAGWSVFSQTVGCLTAVLLLSQSCAISPPLATQPGGGQDYKPEVTHTLVLPVFDLGQFQAYRRGVFRVRPKEL